MFVMVFWKEFMIQTRVFSSTDWTTIKIENVMRCLFDLFRFFLFFYLLLQLYDFDWVND